MTTTFLIGYMGCGKTTLGRAVAEHTGVRFIDLDDYIEERQGCSVKEIFACRG
ncbi:shikimate kinase, partial [uncultured Duncaniella sp.]